MLKILSKAEEEENRKRLRKFVKDNHCEMYNYMLDIEGFKKQGEYKERTRILEVLRNMKFDTKLNEKIYDAIMKEPQKEYKAKLKKMGATVYNQNKK